MADTNYYAKRQQLATQENQPNTSKFYTQFLYKALFVTIFLVILPLFPSQAPEFINQNLLSRSWELLHLLFVGIAVSYGLFSRRNDETEKENNNNHSKFDNAQSYVSRLLQVSSVFDDDADNLSGSDENKVQTWSNQYYRKEPPVVVAATENSAISDKPLLLPVRSLKSRVLDEGPVEKSKESSANSGSLNRSSSGSGSKRFSSSLNRAKNGELGGPDLGNSTDKLNENVVLPSPIPWRSRSGRMEVKEDIDKDNPPMFDFPFSMEESELNRLESRSFRSQTSRSSRPSSTTSSPKLSSSPSLSSPRKLSPSASLSTESQAKSAEDLVNKKSFYRPSPPPPPPPPPPMIHKPSPLKPSWSFHGDGISFEKELRRSFSTESKDSKRMNSSYAEGLSMEKSVRTFRSNDSLNSTPKNGEIEGEMNGFRTDKMNRESVTFMPKPTYTEFLGEERQEFVEKLVMETEEEDEDMESEDDEVAEGCMVSSNGGKSSNNEAASSSAIEEPSDVDKKADEFIAKIREQIRLQRIDSIKRASGQIRRSYSSR